MDLPAVGFAGYPAVMHYQSLIIQSAPADAHA
jgi:hypothetical protein